MLLGQIERERKNYKPVRVSCAIDLSSRGDENEDGKDGKTENKNDREDTRPGELGDTAREIIRASYFIVTRKALSHLLSGLLFLPRESCLINLLVSRPYVLKGHTYTFKFESFLFLISSFFLICVPRPI